MQLTNLIDNDMNYKHFPLECDLRDLRPIDIFTCFQFLFFIKVILKSTQQQHSYSYGGKYM